MLEVRGRWRQHRNDPDKALAMYRAAVDLCCRLKAKYGELMRSQPHH